MGRIKFTQSKNTFMHEMFEKIVHVSGAPAPSDDRRADATRQLMWFSRLMAVVHTFTEVARSMRPDIEEKLIFI